MLLAADAAENSREYCFFLRALGCSRTRGWLKDLILLLRYFRSSGSEIGTGVREAVARRLRVVLVVAAVRVVVPMVAAVAVEEPPKKEGGVVAGDAELLVVVVAVSVGFSIFL